LQPGEITGDAAFYGGFADGGFWPSLGILHRFYARVILPGGLSATAAASLSTTPGKPLSSMWTNPGQRALAEKAAKIGVERFVMDDRLVRRTQ